jgi:uncharacterized membrane protein YheB (UPF0754 family)
MYPDVCSWFKKILKEKHSNNQILVEDTSRKVLSRWIVEKKLQHLFPDYQTYEIEVDVTGIIEEDEKATLGMIECKLNRITLRDFSQLLGYSRVAQPLYSIILSPKGVSKSMHRLFYVSRRNDILYYSGNRYIVIGKWDEKRNEVDFSTIIPKGSPILY